MAKQVKNKKLVRQLPANKAVAASPTKKQGGGAFKSFADQKELRKLKKREKKEDAVTRLIKRNKVNKMADSRLGGSKKKIRFDLDDGEGGFQFTHKGKKLADMEDFEEDEISVSDASQMDEEIVDKLHFSGFDDQPTDDPNKPALPKSKKQVYEEIIAKSKMFKMEKQRIAEQNEEKAEGLDEDYDKLLGTLQFRNKDNRFYADQSKKPNDFASLLNDLRNDEMVACDPVPKTQQQQKQSQNKRKQRKLEQLKQLEEQEEDMDVRGWVNDNVSEEDQAEEDELDDVDLSEEDGEEGEDGDEKGNDGNDGQEAEDSEEEGEQSGDYDNNQEF